MTQPTTQARVRDLTETECVDLLRSHRSGRVALKGADGLYVLPVSYIHWDGKIAFRTAADGVLARLAERSAVAFEIDDLNPEDGIAWSVLVRGFSRQVRSAVPLAELLKRPDLVPWVDGPRRLVIAIEPSSISGRRLQAPRL